MVSPVNNSNLDAIFERIITDNFTSTGRLGVSLTDFLEFVGTVDLETTQTLIALGQSFDSERLSKIRQELLIAAQGLSNDIQDAFQQLETYAGVDSSIVLEDLDVAQENFLNGESNTEVINEAITKIEETNTNSGTSYPLPSSTPPVPPTLETQFAEDPSLTTEEAVDEYNQAVEDYNDAVDDYNTEVNDWIFSILFFNFIEGESLDFPVTLDPLRTLDIYTVNPQGAIRNIEKYEENTAAVDDVIDTLDNGTLNDEIDEYNDAAEAYNNALDNGINTDRVDNLGLEPLPHLPILDNIPNNNPITPWNLNSIDYTQDMDQISDLEDLNNEITDYNNDLSDQVADVAEINLIIAALNENIEFLQGVTTPVDANNPYPDIEASDGIVVGDLTAPPPLELEVQPLEYFYNTISSLLPTDEDIDSGKEFLSLTEMVLLVDQLGFGGVNSSIEEFNAFLHELNYEETDPAPSDTKIAMEQYEEQYSAIVAAAALLDPPVDASAFPLPPSFVFSPPSVIGGDPEILPLSYEGYLLDRVDEVNNYITANEVAINQAIDDYNIANASVQDFEPLDPISIIEFDEDPSVTQLESTISEYEVLFDLFSGGTVLLPEAKSFTLNPLATVGTIEQDYINSLFTSFDEINEHITNTPELSQPPNVVPPITVQPSDGKTLEELEEIYNDYMGEDGYFSQVDEDLVPVEISSFSLTSLQAAMDSKQVHLDFVTEQIEQYNTWATQFNAVLNVLNNPEVNTFLPGGFVPLPLVYEGLPTAPTLPGDPSFISTPSGSNILQNYISSSDPFNLFRTLSEIAEEEADDFDPLTRWLDRNRFFGTALSIDSPGAAGLFLQGAKKSLLPIGTMLTAAISTDLISNAILSTANSQNISSIEYRGTLDGSDGIAGVPTFTLEEIKAMLSAFTLAILEIGGAQVLPTVLSIIVATFGDVPLDDSRFGVFSGLGDLELSLFQIESGFVNQQLRDVFGGVDSAFVDAFSPIAEAQLLNITTNEVVSILDDPQVYYNALIDLGNAIEEGVSIDEAVHEHTKDFREAFDQTLSEKFSELSDEKREQIVDRTLALLFGPSPLTPEFLEEDSDPTLVAEERQAQLHNVVPGGKQIASGETPDASLSALEIFLGIRNEMNEQRATNNRSEITWEGFVNGVLYQLNFDSARATLKALNPEEVILRRGLSGVTSSDDMGDMETRARLNWSV